jgi:hypothetical protein
LVPPPHCLPVAVDRRGGTRGRCPGTSSKGRSGVVGSVAWPTDEAAAWQLAKILKPHGAALDKASRRRLATKAASAIKAGKPVAEALLYVLRQGDVEAANRLLRSAAETAMRAKRWEEAVARFRGLMAATSIDDATRYALSVCNLKASSKDLAAHLRREDHALRGFQGLLRSRDFNLVERLQVDKSLDADDLYYLGFHFNEQMGPEREFGDVLLKHVARKWPRTKAGKAAKAKRGRA